MNLSCQVSEEVIDACPEMNSNSVVHLKKKKVSVRVEARVMWLKSSDRNECTGKLGLETCSNWVCDVMSSHSIGWWWDLHNNNSMWAPIGHVVRIQLYHYELNVRVITVLLHNNMPRIAPSIVRIIGNPFTFPLSTFTRISVRLYRLLLA